MSVVLTDTCVCPAGIRLAGMAYAFGDVLPAGYVIALAPAGLTVVAAPGT